MSATQQPTRIFISYARADREHRQTLEKHLANLKRQGRIDVWTDQVLEPGVHWKDDLRVALHAADILLCLVTADFMASNFIHDVELKQSFERQRHGQVRIFPVLVRPTDLEGHPLDQQQWLPRDFLPITEWSDSDRAWVEVVEELRKVLDTPLIPQAVPQPLPEGYAPLPEGHPPSALLVARYGVVPFYEPLRAQALARIQGWLDAPRSFDVLLVTGDAGTGKTRLLYEVVARRRKAFWVAGLRDARQTLAELKTALEKALPIPHPLLVAIDYAETAPELDRLLEWLQQQASRRQQPVRVLLAARGTGDWWQSLCERSRLELSTLLRAAPLALEPESGVSHSDHLQALHQDSLRRFSEVLSRPDSQPLHDQTLHGQTLHGQTLHGQTLHGQTLHSQTLHGQTLHGQTLHGQALSQRPLFVLLTALAQTLGLTPEPDALVQALVLHEFEFWETLLPTQHFVRPRVLSDLKRVVSGISLRGGLRSRRELTELLERLDLVPELRPTEVQGFLEAVYPGAGQLLIRPLEPDLLAVELVRQVLCRPDGEPLLEPALADNSPGALATAFRLLEDLGQQDKGLGRRALETVLSQGLEARALSAIEAATRWKGERPQHLIAEVLLGRLKQGVSVELLVAIHNALPRSSLALMEGALWVTSALRERLGELNMADEAMFLISEGIRFSDLGRREEAFAATQEAVTLYRRLAEQDPERFTPDLAGSLNNLGNMLSSLGRREEALAAAQEAVTLYRRLAMQTPDSIPPNMSTSINNLGNRLSDLGRREEALVATAEAVTLLRQLAHQAPDAFTPDLALSLNNQGKMLSDQGRWEEALVATEEAVTLYRVLAEQAPDAVIPDLARSLSNLGRMRNSLGRWEEALAATKEAVAYYRQLAKQSPEAFIYYLALSLNNLGADLTAMGRRDEALAATIEAVTLRRELAHLRPEVSAPGLASSLTNLGSDLGAFGQHEEALEATVEAVALYRPLAQRFPDAYIPELAKSLNNLGTGLNALGRREDALAAFREAVMCLTPFFVQLPQAHGENWRMFARNLRLCCQVSGIDPASDPALQQCLAQLTHLETQASQQ